MTAEFVVIYRCHLALHSEPFERFACPSHFLVIDFAVLLIIIVLSNVSRVALGTTTLAFEILFHPRFSLAKEVGGYHELGFDISSI